MKQYQDRMRSAHFAKTFEKYKWKRRPHIANCPQSCPVTTSSINENKRKQSYPAVSNSSSIRSSNVNDLKSKLKSHVLLSIVEGRGQSAGEIGLATIDIYCANVELSQFRDTSSYSRTLVKLLLYCPSEIILPRSGLEPNSCMRKLVKVLLSLRSDMNLNGVNRNHFNDKQGLYYLRRLCHPHFIPSIYAIKEKFYALSALSALLNYAEETHGLIYAPKSMKFSFTGSVKSTMIDYKSANHLGLVRNNYDYSAKDTLYSAIDFTSTVSGARLLRSNLLEPPCDLETILNRQASVRELISSPDTLLNIQNILRQFPHIDSLLSLCVQICSSSNKMFTWDDTNNKSCIKTSDQDILNEVDNNSKTNPSRSNKSKESITSSTTTCTQTTDYNHSPLINTIRRKTTGLLSDRSGKPSTSTWSSSSIRQHLLCSSFITPSSEKYSQCKREMIHLKKAVNIQAAESRITKVIAIKYMLDLVKLLYDAMGDVSSTLLRTYKEEGLSVVLDVTRKAYSEQLDDITSEVSRLARQYNLPLRISHNKARGFYIQIPEDSLKTYIKPSSSNIDDIKRIKGSLFEVYHIADQIISDLITGLHPGMALFYRLSEVIAGLDLLASFARMSINYSLRNHFVCPIFNDILGIKNGRNIVTDEEKKSLSVPNHTYASPLSNFHIITGPPMCGKTTYLRQIAYIQILAQIGSFVPAEFAAVRITDQIFFHAQGQDDLILGESSFVNEIRELTYVLQNFTSSSIILIDGLCHNTDPDEVKYLNWAICEAFLEHKAFTFLATNRYELSSLASVYPNVENYYFSMQEEFVNMYDGHQTGRLNQSTYEVSFGNNSNTIEESPLVHSFSNDLNCTKVNKQLNNYDVGQITFTYKLNKGLSPKLMYGT
ncbi:MutS protein 4 isoform 2 [Schistosoma japonicum]|uniref:MutS protein 4 isoform 2 n=1 Tax=Schistosoma japonicum TaxID=6182 RepID=A0A4Z2CVH3_SCHJA|nr:MutS protein 4 isoform 2 [Schistosoma japonicum]